MDPVSEFRQFYKDHYQAVRRSAGKHRVPKSERDAVAQEVFVRALGRSGNGDSILPLLVHIARNEACRFHERRRRQSPPANGCPLDVIADIVADDSTTPEESIQRSQRLRFVLDRLDELDYERRITFEMAEIHGMQQSEIAAEWAARSRVVDRGHGHSRGDAVELREMAFLERFALVIHEHGRGGR